MRKIKYKKWIPFEYTEWIECSRTQIPNTGCYESDYINEGYFHIWTQKQVYGQDLTIIALIEIEDGTIVEVLPCNIKFIKE